MATDTSYDEKIIGQAIGFVKIPTGVASRIEPAESLTSAKPKIPSFVTHDAIHPVTGQAFTGCEV